MDFQNRVGSKFGGGGPASSSETNVQRRLRLMQLAMETIDLEKDPYFFRNHLGKYECKLCGTLHNNEGSYLAHTQGKKHQQNLARRAARDAKDKEAQPATLKPKVEIKKFVKIGRPGYQVTKQRDAQTMQQSLLFQIDLPEIGDVRPRHRIMSAFEQRVEAPDRAWQYLLFAAEPYETIAFKIPAREIDKGPDKLWTVWNADSKQFFLQLHFAASAAKQVDQAHADMMRNNNSNNNSNNQMPNMQTGGNFGAPPPPGGMPFNPNHPPAMFQAVR